MLTDFSPPGVTRGALYDTVITVTFIITNCLQTLKMTF